MAVDVKIDGSTFAAGTPKPLFQTHIAPVPRTYTVTADGQRFLINTIAEETTPPPFNVVLNWAAGLKR